MLYAGRDGGGGRWEMIPRRSRIGRVRARLSSFALLVRDLCGRAIAHKTGPHLSEPSLASKFGTLRAYAREKIERARGIIKCKRPKLCSLKRIARIKCALVVAIKIERYVVPMYS